MSQAIQDFVFVLNIVVPTLSSFSHMQKILYNLLKFLYNATWQSCGVWKIIFFSLHNETNEITSYDDADDTFS
jgi:hypothetical protein